MEAIFWTSIGVVLGALPIGIFAFLEWRKRVVLAERLVHQAQLEQELKAAQIEARSLSQKTARLEVELEKERELSHIKLATLRQSEEKLSQAFRALSSEALKANNESFLQLAKTSLERFQESAKAELDKRSQAIDDSVKPVSESLQKFEAKMEAVEKGRAEGQAAMKSQVSALLSLQFELKSETTKLATALRATSVRGRWGELQLRRVVELAGMLDHCDFTTQTSASSEEGIRRPDLLVHLPGERTIVVDAKAPLDAFLEASETSQEERRTVLLKKHAEQLRQHIRQLASKAYSSLFTSAPEFVILFVPGEMILHSALAQDPSLIEQGAEKGVLLAAPTTLISLLRAASVGWRQEKLSHNAQEICDLGQELYKRLSVMAQHWAKVGKGLDSAVKFYNEAVGSLERRVLVSARKFETLSASQGACTLEGIAPIDRLPQPPRAVVTDQGI